MEIVAAFMQNESAVIAVGMIAMIIGVTGLLVLGAICVASTFVRRLPGGSLTFAGFATIIAMFAFASLMKGAQKGSLNAMLNLGISYWKGSGVAVDRVEAFKWLDLARFYTQRSENLQLKWRVRGALDELQNEMSKAEIREGKRRSKEWDASHRSK